MQRTILVTGGAGFLGANLCRSLLNAGNTVIALDNLCTGRVQNIAHLRDNPNFTFLQQDVCDPLTLPVQQIYNLACPASPPRYQADPIGTLRTNFVGMQNTLELARTTGARLVQASTSEVYGDPAVHPQHEEYFGNVNPIGVRACYDEGKRVAETLCVEYARVHNVDTKIVRIFNTYGPYMDPEDGRVVSNFICNALQGKPLQLYGDGSQTRSFCYVDDLIAGLQAMMASQQQGPINLGNPTEYTMQQLAQLVLELTQSSSEVVTQPLPGDDPTRRKPDITRAQRELGWQPSISLRDGLVRTIDYFRSQL